MPSPFPRISVVVTPDHHKVLERLSKLEGRSISSFVRQVIEVAMPTWEQLLTTVEKAAIQRNRLDDGFQTAVEELLSEAEYDLEEQLSIEDFISGKGAGARGRRGAKPRDTVIPSPSTDRGVKDASSSTIVPISKGKRK